MALNTIEEIIEDIRKGKMIVLMDDEDRENEGDLIIAAEKVTPEVINFMASKARGLICMPMTAERCEYLGLTSMVSSNGAAYGTPFTQSIEAAEGVTTGISAQDRALTVQVAADPKSAPDDLVQPGHIFPLRAQPGGVLSRAGHTEAGTDLARLAGLEPAAVLVEIMNEDGTMARRPELEAFAQEHDLKISTIADLIQYRTMHEKSIELVEERPTQTQWGEFNLRVYQGTGPEGQHLVLSKGEFDPETPALVRVHVAQMLRDVVGIDVEGKEGWSLSRSLAKVAEEGSGIVVLLDSQNGFDPLMELERFHSGKKVKRNENADRSRTYTTIGTGSQILRDMNVGKMRLLSSPVKFGGISGFGLEVVEYIQFSQD